MNRLTEDTKCVKPKKLNDVPEAVRCLESKLIAFVWQRILLSTFPLYVIHQTSSPAVSCTIEPFDQ